MTSNIRFQHASRLVKLARLRYLFWCPFYFLRARFGCQDRLTTKLAWAISVELCQAKMNWLYRWPDCPSEEI